MLPKFVPANVTLLPQLLETVGYRKAHRGFFFFFFFFFFGGGGGGVFFLVLLIFVAVVDVRACVRACVRALQY